MAPTTIDRTVDLAEFERRLQHIEDRATAILQELEGFDRDLEELQAAGYPGFIDEIGNGIAAMWTGYVRSLQRTGRLPPQL